jgi:hypothetical protein
MGSGLLPCFTGPLIGVDTVEQFIKDVTFYRKLNLPAAETLIVDRDRQALEAAREAGFQTALLCFGEGDGALLMVSGQDG